MSTMTSGDPDLRCAVRYGTGVVILALLLWPAALLYWWATGPAHRRNGVVGRGA